LCTSQQASARKGTFGPISPSTCALACAVHYPHPFARALDFFEFAQESSCPIWQLFRVRGLTPGRTRVRFALQKVSTVDLVVDPHVCLCEDLQRASAQPLDSLDIGRTGLRPEGRG